MRHYYDITQQKRNGLTIPAPGIQVTVFLQGTQTLATLFSDDGITQTLTPGVVFSDANGRFDFYVANGRYDLSFTGPGVNSFTQLNVEITDAMDTTSLGKTPITFTANNTHSGVETFSGSLGIPNGTPVPALCLPGQFFYDTAGLALNVCTSPNTWTAMTSTTATGVPNIWTALQTFTGGIGVNSNAAFKGPNPYVDIAAFGARAVNPNITPAAVGLTANCTNTQNTVTISAASTFVNGDGVVLYGCGAPHSMTTPAGVTVTPSVALAGTGTLVNTPGPAGATTYNYQVIARDRNGGLTAPSSTASTATGAASLGGQTVNITSLTASGQTVTVVTAAAHGFLVGCGVSTCGEVFIGGGNGITDATFRGWFTVVSAADSTHFTFNRPKSTALGATASATGGTATFYNLNKVSWTAVTGAVQYALYSDRAVAGTCALIGISNANSANGTVDTTLEDFGSPMMDNQAFNPIFPASYPCASPPAATSDSLSTTIASGAGTTTLTLTNAAGTTISGQTIRLDAAPNIAAAAASITSGYGSLLIPAVSTPGAAFVINSWLQLNAVNFAVAQNGPLFLNDTIEVIDGTAAGNQWLGQATPQQNFKGIGGWSSGPKVTINTAHPGFFFSGQQFGLHVSHISPIAVPSNGAKVFLIDGGFNQVFDWIDCQSGGGSNDYMSMCYEFRASPGQSNANVVLDYVGMSPGGGSDGASHTPTIYLRNNGNAMIPHSYSVHRGMLATGAGPSLGVGGIANINGGGTPLLTTLGTSGVTLGSITMDTIAQPCVAALASAFGSAQIVSQGACQPASGVLPFSGGAGTASGGAIQAQASANDFSASTPGGYGLQIGSITDTFFGFVNSYPQNFFNTGMAIGKGYPVFIQGDAPVITSCPVSAGGSLSVGTHTFFLVPLWWNNNQGRYSAPCVATTSSGNQTVTLNYNAFPGNPQLLRIYDGTNNRLTNITASPTAGSVVISSETLSGGTPDQFPAGGPTMLMDGVKGIATPQLIVAGTPFVSTTLPTISAHFNTSGDSITATSTATFLITVGTGAGTSTGAITLPTAPNGWNCELSNKNRAATIQQTGDTTTSATFTNFGTTFAATNWTNGDVLYGSCFPR